MMRCRFADESLAKDLADTLDVAVDKLLNGLTTKHIVTAGETFHKPLNTEFSTTNRDTMAQNLYVSWLAALALPGVAGKPRAVRARALAQQH